MKVDLHSVLIQPLLTEKVTALRESSNTVGFLVHPDANRLQIKQAVEIALKSQGRARQCPERAGQNQAPGPIFGEAIRLEEGLCDVEARREARVVRKRITS